MVTVPMVAVRVMATVAPVMATVVRLHTAHPMGHHLQHLQHPLLLSKQA